MSERIGWKMDGFGAMQKGDGESPIRGWISATQSGPSEPASPLPSVSLPVGGGAIRGIGEKFAANPVTGSASLSVPIYASPGQAALSPHLSLSYDSMTGNGAFGFGWSLDVPSITRKTDKGLPQYGCSNSGFAI